MQAISDTDLFQDLNEFLPYLYLLQIRLLNPTEEHKVSLDRRHDKVVLLKQPGKWFLFDETLLYFHFLKEIFELDQQ